jgi:hypothetical protein
MRIRKKKEPTQTIADWFRWQNSVKNGTGVVHHIPGAAGRPKYFPSPLAQKYANYKKKKKTWVELAMKTVDSIRINFRFFFLSRTSFSYLIEKMSTAKIKKRAGRDSGERKWRWSDLWWWSRPSGGRCSTTPGGNGEGTRVTQFKWQSDRDVGDRTLAAVVSMVSLFFFCFPNVKTILLIKPN